MRKVEKTYKQCCRDYGIGFASAFFMAGCILAIVAIAGYSPNHDIPISVHNTVIIFFNSFTIFGFIIIVLAYKYPIRFYEFMEDD